MARLTAKNPYKAALMRSLHGVEKQLNMDIEDIMLILLEMDTEEKIIRFAKWMKNNMDGEKILAMPNEIVRAACEISDSLDEETNLISEG